jgi:hypothetical protein
LENVSANNDYYRVTLYIDNGSDRLKYEGAFYVKTSRGTYYWAKALSDKDFAFDTQAVDAVEKASNFGITRVNTQRDDFRYLNPGNCY